MSKPSPKECEVSLLNCHANLIAILRRLIEEQDEDHQLQHLQVSHERDDLADAEGEALQVLGFEVAGGGVDVFHAQLLQLARVGEAEDVARVGDVLALGAHGEGQLLVAGVAGLELGHEDGHRVEDARLERALLLSGGEERELVHASQDVSEALGEHRHGSRHELLADGDVVGEIDEVVEDLATELYLVECLLEEGKSLQRPTLLLGAVRQRDLEKE